MPSVRNIKVYFLDFESARTTHKNSLLAQLMLGVNTTEQQDAARFFWNGGHYRIEFEGMYVCDPEKTLHEVAESFFRKTQNIDEPWVENGEPKRSSMVGDLFQVDDTYFLCAPLGFKEINIEDSHEAT